MPNIELLAPAGDLERLKIACLYGADAIYIGGQNFSLRANALNFSLEDIKKGVEYTHKYGKKIYVAVNIVFHEQDLENIEKYLLKLDKIGVDAIIVSDVIVMELWQKLKLKMELHISTQASILNYETAKFYKEIGASRIVLAREASKEDIIRIKKETNLDLECFVHGAMCTSFSGRCVLSNYATNRDSNRGGCAQICRWMFNPDNSSQIFSMTPKDLNFVSQISEMLKIGVNSFKIEGRMRSIYYIATVVGVYRKIIDKVINNNLSEAYNKYYLSILNRCANRDSTAQFFDKIPGKEEQYFLGRDEVSNQDFLGIILAYDTKTHEVTLEQRNYFKSGDVVEFFGPNLEATTFTIPQEIFDSEGKNIDVARHPRMIVKFKTDIKLSPYDMMRVKVLDICNFW